MRGRGLGSWTLGLALGLIAATAGAGFVGVAEDGGAGKPKRPSIYDKTADAEVRVRNALVEAAKRDKRVLLMFGGDWCGWCHKLHDLFNEDPEITKLLVNDYFLVMIDTEAPNADGYFKEASKGQEGVGFPFLAVYDATGKLLVGQKTDPLEEGDHHDPAKVKAFLEKWRVEPKDAEATVKDAVSRAASQDKRVFLAFGAPWCGWCHRLDDFLARPEIAAAVGEGFVTAKVDIDRDAHGRDVMLRYRKSDSGGIPWYVLLDAEGKATGTADAEIGNIGYPLEPKEIDAFVKLLESQKTLGQAQLDAVRTGLVENAERIRKLRSERPAPPVEGD